MSVQLNLWQYVLSLKSIKSEKELVMEAKFPIILKVSSVTRLVL